MPITNGPPPLDLRDIHLPAEPSWWPPAPGWWLLLVLAALIVWWLTRIVRKSLRRRRRVQRVLTELEVIEQVLSVEQQPSALLAAYSGLVRRTCKAYAPSALMLSGEDWLAFLDGDDPSKPFSTGPGRVLLDGPFKPTVDSVDVSPLSDLLRRRLRLIAEHLNA